MENQTKTKLTLNPEEEKQSNILLEGAPVRQTVQPIVQTQTEYNAGSIDESMLSNDEKEMVAQFANEIDISNAKQVIQYGSSAQKSISDFSVNILGKVKTSELGDVGDALKELTVALDATTEPEKKGILGIFQKAKRGVDSIKANYAKAETNVSRIEKDLEKHQVVLTQDVEMFEQMYDLNLQYYRELTMYIIAGKKALDKARGEQLEALKVKAETSQMQEDVENYNKYVNLCNRFEKKLHDLELTRVIAMQVSGEVTEQGVRYSYEELFGRFAYNYWNLVVKYDLRQMRKDGKSEFSKVELILKDAIKRNEILTNLEFESLDSDTKYKIIKQVTAECKRFVIGALYDDFDGIIYSFNLKEDGIVLNPRVYDFMLKYKAELEKLNYYAWARFLEQINDDNVLVRVIDKLELATPKREDLSVYREILRREFEENTCFYCGKKLGKNIHVDHFIPWSFVKDDKLWNFVLSCARCNERKSNRLPVMK